MEKGIEMLKLVIERTRQMSKDELSAFFDRALKLRPVNIDCIGSHWRTDVTIKTDKKSSALQITSNSNISSSGKKIVVKYNTTGIDLDSYANPTEADNYSYSLAA